MLLLDEEESFGNIAIIPVVANALKIGVEVDIFLCERVRHSVLTHSALACGSMVLYLYCMSFFRPAGRKNAGALWATRN